ncbi:hypothetical protein HDU79_002137 [Rhizoclosmatium sp. JEL0117]|nr:hypothetical protein HDU79_002137 [Rhizoclosmatium sp. JEL0117]
MSTFSFSLPPIPLPHTPPLWTSRRLPGHSIHYSQLRTVQDPTLSLGDSFLYKLDSHPSAGSGGTNQNNVQVVVTRDNCRDLVFPRVRRARGRVREIEERVEGELATQFEGLTEDQRDSVLHLVKRNAKLREMNRKLINKDQSSVEGSQDKISMDNSNSEDVLKTAGIDFVVYDYILKGGGDLKEGERKFRSDVEEEEKNQKKEAKEVGSRELGSDGELVTEKNGSNSTLPSLSTLIQKPAVPAIPHIELTPRQKYAKLVAKRDLFPNTSTTLTSTSSPTTTEEQLPAAAAGLEEMKRVTKGLHDWSQNMINAPINLFDNKNLPKITPSPWTTTTTTTNQRTGSPPKQGLFDLTGTSPAGIITGSGEPILLQPSTQPGPTGPSPDTNTLTVPGLPGDAHKSTPGLKDDPLFVDSAYGEFDVLLNACKPTATESKLSIRLNVVQETNPPCALVAALKENLGYEIRTRVEGLKVAEERVARRVVRKDFVVSTHPVKEGSGHKRVNYGNWYIKPDMWNEYMLKSGAEKNPKPRPKMGGLVQQKLDQIMVVRAKEEAAFQAALMQSLGGGGGGPPGVPVPSAGGGQGERHERGRNSKAGIAGHDKSAHTSKTHSRAVSTNNLAASRGGGVGASINNIAAVVAMRSISRQVSMNNIENTTGAAGRAISVLRNEMRGSVPNINSAGVPEEVA